MTNWKNKTKLIAAATLIILMATSMTAVLSVNAQTELPRQEGGSIPLPAGVTPDLRLETIPHMSFRPNPVGVDQKVLVNLWMQPPLHVSRYFTDYTLTITDPDGKKTVKTMDSYRADATAWYEFKPDKIGTWKLKFDFPGAYFPAGIYTIYQGAFFGAGDVPFPQSVYYEPSSTDEVDLVVQEDPVEFWPSSPLPTDYWTRPVSPNNREWWTILGNFPATGFVGGGKDWPADTNIYSSNYLYTPYVQAPNTGHVLWKRDIALGGLYGPGFPEDSYVVGGMGATGTPSIIYEGRCYGTVTKSVNGVSTSFWQCYDLRTGEIYWEQAGVPAATFIMYETGWAEVPGGEASFGKNVYLATITGGGGMFGMGGGGPSNLIKYDPYTGAVVQNVSIAPLTGGTFYANPYFLSVQNIGTMYEPEYRLINWTVQGEPGYFGQITNIGVKVANNISYPFSSIGGFGSAVDYEAGVAVYTSSVTHPATGSDVPIDVRIMGASLTTGDLLWNVSSTVGFSTFPAAIADHGKFAARFNDGHWHCYDLHTGEHLWTSEETSFPWGTFGCYGQQSYGGMILSNQYDGIAAFNWTNGKIVWFYQDKAPYPYETPYQSNYPFFTGTTLIADGKLYTFNAEHTTTQPVTRGWKMHCLNITTGEPIFTIDGDLAPGAVADGYLVASGTYDGYMYVIGKGKSQTTVTAPDIPITLGDSVVIRGTVTDLSPAQTGAACVSDESMSPWMGYLHMQEPIPTNATGITVNLDVIDANNNYRPIGTATTDLSGTFSYMWQPDIPGKYTVVASFKGSESYGSSYAETAFGVVDAPDTQPTDTTNTIVALPNMELYLAVATALIIVAIATVGILLLRKKP